LSAYGNTLAGSAEVGDELAQEALARLYPKQEPRAYAFRIVTNLSRTRWTKLARERLTSQQLHDPTPQPGRSRLRRRLAGVTGTTVLTAIIGLVVR
jgi:DNA-directed RNA polymerase specialized sigma24 family protein